MQGSPVVVAAAVGTVWLSVSAAVAVPLVLCLAVQRLPLSTP